MFGSWKKQVLRVYQLTIGEELPHQDEDLEDILKTMYKLFRFSPEQAANSLNAFLRADNPQDVVISMGEQAVKATTLKVQGLINTPAAEALVRAAIKTYMVAKANGDSQDVALMKMVDASALSSHRATILKEIEDYRFPEKRHPGQNHPRPSDETEMQWLVSELFELRFGAVPTDSVAESKDSERLYTKLLWELIERCSAESAQDGV